MVGWVRWLAGLLVVLGAGVAVPAWAHADIESSLPTDGSTLGAPPDALVFTFREDLLPEGSAITLTDLDADERLPLGEVAVTGPTVSVGWPAGAGAGRFRSAYRVVSADGHPITGSIMFTVLGPGDRETPSPAGASPAPSGSSSLVSPAPSGSSSLVSPAPSGSSSDVSPAPSGSAVPAASEEVGVEAVTWILAVGLVVLAGAGAGTWYLRRSR
jgi:hypothetical protein